MGQRWSSELDMMLNAINEQSTVLWTCLYIDFLIVLSFSFCHDLWPLTVIQLVDGQDLQLRGDPIF